MTSLRRALVALGAAGLVAGVVPLVAALANDGEEDRLQMAVFGPLVTWSFVGTGLFAWLRRPENPVGALMTAVGFSWCASALIVAENQWLFIVGFLATPLPYVVLMHLLLAFPDGRLHSTIERVLVATGYLSAAVVHSLVTLFTDTSDDQRGFPDNSLLVGDPDLGEAFGRGPAALGTLLVGAVAVVLERRWRGERGSQRRALLPVLVTGVLVAGLLLLWLVARVAGLTDAQDALETARIVLLALVPFAYLAGLLHSRVAGAAAVSELVARLGDPDERGRGLRAALADALGDPSLELVYWLPERRQYVDADGRPVELPREGSGRIWTAVKSRGERVAAIVQDASLDSELELVRAAGAAASIALENERLDAELRAKLEELSASRARIVQSSDAARRRIERDLHDGAQQRLLSLALNLRLLQSTL